MSKAYWLRSRVSEASMEEMARHEREREGERKKKPVYPEPNSILSSSVECVLSISTRIVLCMEFSGLRSRAFCRVGKSCSLNSEWEIWRSREPHLAWKETVYFLRYCKMLKEECSLGQKVPHSLTRICWSGLVLLISTVFKYRSKIAAWKNTCNRCVWI